MPLRVTPRLIRANELFGNQDNALRHLDDFRKYRNLFAHSNKDELTDVMRKNAEAAIIWLQAVFDANPSDEPEPQPSGI